MHVPDLINGSFEFWGAVACWCNVYALYKDKMVKGVRLGPMAFFTSWGFWNLYYYPHLNQMMSFVGGSLLVVANTVWLSMMVYYMRKNNEPVLHQ